ncbi:MAG: hypothetical protein ACI867_002270, partial [Glaciecola sp.]
MDEPGVPTPSEADDAVEGSTQESVVRARRSDARRSSRRRRKKREAREAREAVLAASQEQAAREAPAAPVELALDEEIQIEPESKVDPEPTSRRTERRAVARRRRSAVVLGRGALVVALVTGAASLGVGLRFLTRDGEGVVVDDAGEVVLGDGVDRQPTLLLVTSGEGPGQLPADSAIVLGYDRLQRTGTILLIPVSTVADIPGHGVLPLSRSLEFGGAALVAQTTDNLLGTSIDGVAAMSYRSWATFFGRVGALEIEVPERIVTTNEDGDTQVQFLAGVQQLDGQRAAQYLGAKIANQAELSALPRIQALLMSWLAVVAADPLLLDEVLGEQLPMIDTGMARSEVVDLFRELALASAQDRVEVRVLPVRPIGSGADDGYRTEPIRLDQLVADRFAGSVSTLSREGRSLQVLNGNGLPGIGQAVAARLLPAGFRVGR